MGKDLQLGERAHSAASGEPALADKSLAWRLRTCSNLSPANCDGPGFHHLGKMSGTVSLGWAAGEMKTATCGGKDALSRSLAHSTS